MKKNSAFSTIDRPYGLITPAIPGGSVRQITYELTNLIFQNNLIFAFSHLDFTGSLTLDNLIH